MAGFHYYVITIVVVSSAIDQHCGRCPCSWEYFEVTDACYKRFERPRSFDDAESRCRVFLGHLTSIHSFLENDFVEKIAEKGTLTDKTDDGLAWIGLMRRNNSETWIWSDGSPYGYNKWAGQPENKASTEKCAQMVKTFTKRRGILFKGLWHDANCDSNATYFICKKKA